MQIVRLVMMIAAVAGVIYALEYMERGIAVWFWITLLGVGFVGLLYTFRLTQRRVRLERRAKERQEKKKSPDIAPGGFFWRGLRRRAGNFGKFSGRSMRLSWPGIFGSCRVPIRRAMRTPSLRSPPPPEDFAVVIGGKAVGGIGLAPGTDVGRFNAGIGCRIGASYRGLVPGTGCYDRRRGAGRGAGFRKYPDNSYLCRRIRLESRFAAGAGQSRIPFRGDDALRFCRERSVRGRLLL